MQLTWGMRLGWVQSLSAWSLQLNASAPVLSRHSLWLRIKRLRDGVTSHLLWAQWPAGAEGHIGRVAAAACDWRQRWFDDGRKVCRTKQFYLIKRSTYNVINLQPVIDSVGKGSITKTHLGNMTSVSKCAIK